MLADGVDGELITWGSDGVAATVAVGTASHVLMSNGAGAPPTFQAAPGGGSVATDAVWDAAGDLVQGTGANTAAKLTMGGALALPRVNAGATAIEWGSPGQMVFPAAQNASADPNTLDDQEEGAYVATVTCSTSGSYTIDAAFDTLSYTKFGRLVFVSGTISVTGEATPNGDLHLSLPFTSADLADGAGRSIGAGVIRNHGGTIANGTFAYVDEGVAYAVFKSIADDGSQQVIDHDDVDTAFVLDVGFSFLTAT